ncbi:uncharacterized protein ASPGLDRAFT_1491707, partial [Aspergillus glaucus CBS 516.65]
VDRIIDCNLNQLQSRRRHKWSDLSEWQDTHTIHKIQLLTTQEEHVKRPNISPSTSLGSFLATKSCYQWTLCISPSASLRGLSFSARARAKSPQPPEIAMFDASARSRTMALTPYEMLVSIIVFVLITAISWMRWHLSSSRAMDLLRNVWPIVIKARRRWSVGVSLPPNWNGAASVSIPTHSLEHVSFHGDVLFCRSSSRQA